MLPGLSKRVFSFHDVIMYVAIARRHLRLMLLLLCFTWLGGLVYYVYARPVYRSYSMVKVNLVDRELPAEKVFREGAGLGTVMRELQSPMIVERTAAKLGVKADYRSIMKSYVKKISLRPDGEGLSVDFYPYTLDWAKRFPQMLVEELKTYRQQRRKEELEERQSNYQKDAQQLTALIAADQEKLTSTHTELNTQKAKIEFDQLKNVPRDLVDVGIRIERVGRVQVEVIGPGLNTVEKLSRISSVLEPLPIGTTITGLPVAEKIGETTEGATPEPQTDLPAQIVTPQLAINNPAWPELSRRIHSLNVKKEELLANGKLEGHESVKAVLKEINATEILMEGELRSEIERLNIEFSHLLDRQKILTAKLPEFEKSQANYMNLSQKEEMARKSAVQWKSYFEKMAQERNKGEFAIDKEHVDFSFVGMDEVKANPVSPNRFTLLLLTTALGLGLGLGIPFLIEYLDHTLSNLEQVESTFQLRGLGIVPKLESADNTVTMMDTDQQKQTHLLENFRVIRTNLLSMGSVTKAPHVMMVTSAMPKEGKTVVSSNLALSFAQTGAKTLLMDTDLRRGRLHRLFGYRKQPGLSGVLLGQHPLEDAIRPTAHENLFILSAGQHLETGTELLGSQQFKDAMVTLRQRFDRIVIDTPPVLGLSETSVIQSQIDGVLFVIWSGHTPVKAVKAAIEMLQSNGANFYGFILNRLDLSASANYYQYYYYSHDYYYHYTPRPLENIT